MSKLIGFLGKMAIVIYFFSVMLPIILMLIFVPLILISEIGTIREAGFATSSIGTTFISVSGLFIGISLLVPAFRIMYYKLPWMLPLVKILFIDVVILSIGVMILNFGYEIQSETRHTLFFVLMLIQLILCRAAMCIYFNKNKVQWIGDDINGQ